MGNEIWKGIIGYEGLYEVSNLGRVKSLKKDRYNYRGTWIQREKILKDANCGGYRIVSLTKNLTHKSRRVHILVAESFIYNKRGLKEINHKNGIKTDNNVENLEWCTRSENCIHSYAMGLSNSTGNKAHNRILSYKQVLEIRDKFIPFVYKRKQLAQEYNVSEATIKAILSRKIWSRI